MKKSILLVSIASIAAVAGSFAFILGNKGIHIEAAKADPVTATVTFDKDHHASDFVGGYDDREMAEYNAATSNGGHVATWLQHRWSSGECVHDKEPASAFYSYTSKGTGSSHYFFLRMEVAGLTNISWNISYTGLDDTNHGSLAIGGRTDYWGYQSTIHNSSLYNNGENSVDCSIDSPYHLELQVSDIPEGATVTINSIVVTYDVAACKTARAA